MPKSPEFKCCICSGTEIGVEFIVTRPDKYGTYGTQGKAALEPRYFECRACGVMIFQGDADFENAYSEGFYYSVDGDPNEFLEKRFQQILNLPPAQSDNIQRVTRIKEFLAKHPFFSTPPYNVLDIGSGMGVFFHKFLDSSWKGVAVEPEPHACVHLKKVLPNVEVIHGYSSDISRSRKFHLVTMNRVLEHIADPLPALQVEYEHILDNGFLYLEVPDVLSYFNDGPNNEAFGYGHFVVYSPHGLETIARKAGFELIHLNRVIEPSTKFSLYAFFRKCKNH